LIICIFLIIFKYYYNTYLKKDEGFNKIKELAKEDVSSWQKVFKSDRIEVYKTMVKLDSLKTQLYIKFSFY
jgi:hypothetical protein